MRNRRPPPSDDWDVTVVESSAPPPPPPAPPSRSAAVDEPSDPPPGILELGPPPTDPEQSQLWGYRALQVLAFEAMGDKKIGSERRIKLVRSTLMAAARLYPDAAKEEVAKKIREHEKRMADKRTAKASANIEAAPAMANVIPIRG